RLIAAYVLVFAVSAGLAATSFALGKGRHSQPDISGVYDASGVCTGRFDLKQSGQFVDLSGAVHGSLRFRHGRLDGAARCGGHAGSLCLHAGCAGAVRGTFVESLPAVGLKAPAKPPPGEEIFGRLMLAIAAVIVAARAVRWLVGRVGQPAVMGEVLAG